ncbi:MAG: hypothetical protein QNI87_14450 [Erythrobacter sp.]|uniref:hypothetical protein n=1 Tax=Erythrobacter sp. TaxID=1042 RepID=UPI00262E4B4C|nr:hypothetical protein [Erythrobacter sp.]MDJ0979723.1 hypothetical protein [Erythrobacter sp.]
MRVLFYLPVITPWWFESIITPLISKLYQDNEVHILAPELWQGTGLSLREVQLCAHMPDIRWHIVNDQKHPSMRTDPAEREGIISFVQSLDPDIVLCRSADVETIKAFPGIVRHITEGAADPLSLPSDILQFSHSLFDHGSMPELECQQVAALEDLIEPFWSKLLQTCVLDQAQRDYLCKWSAFPGDRPVLFLPLEYEHEENFYTMHRIDALSNVELLEDLAQRFGERIFFALTNHPLNELYVDNEPLNEAVEARSWCMRMFPQETPLGGRTTDFLIGAADGVFLMDSKVYALAGFHGSPIVRRSRFRTGAWLNVYDAIEDFLADYETGTLQRPAQKDAKVWFAFHAANNLINLNAPQLSGADLIERISTPVDPDRWADNFAQLSIDWPKAVP